MSELKEGRKPSLKTRKGAPASAPNRVDQSIQEVPFTEDSPSRQATWLASRFGLPVEIAATIASLAWGLAMSTTPTILCQLRAIVELAISRNSSVDLLTVHEAVSKAKLALEDEIRARQSFDVTPPRVAR